MILEKKSIMVVAMVVMMVEMMMITLMILTMVMKETREAFSGGGLFCKRLLYL